MASPIVPKVDTPAPIPHKVDRLMQYGKMITKPLEAGTKLEGGGELKGRRYASQVASNIGHNILATIRRIVVSITTLKVLDNPTILKKIGGKIKKLEMQVAKDKALTETDLELIVEGVKSMRAACQHLVGIPKHQDALNNILHKIISLEDVIENLGYVTEEKAPSGENEGSNEATGGEGFVGEGSSEATGGEDKNRIEATEGKGVGDKESSELPLITMEEPTPATVAEGGKDPKPTEATVVKEERNEATPISAPVLEGGGEGSEPVKAEVSYVKQAYIKTDKAFKALLEEAEKFPGFHEGLGRFWGGKSQDNQILRTFSDPNKDLQANPETPQAAIEVIDTIEKGLVQIDLATWKDEKDRDAGIKIDEKKHSALFKVHSQAVEAYNDLCDTIYLKKTEDAFKDCIAIAQKRDKFLALDSELKSFVENGFNPILKTLTQAQDIGALVTILVLNVGTHEIEGKLPIKPLATKEELDAAHTKAVAAYEELKAYIDDKRSVQ